MLTPIHRIEYFLDAIINGTAPPSPVYRIEYFLAKIAGADVTPPVPVYPIEFFLAKLIDSSVETPAPTSRAEKLLSMIGGDDARYPDLEQVSWKSLHELLTEGQSWLPRRCNRPRYR